MTFDIFKETLTDIEKPLVDFYIRVLQTIDVKDPKILEIGSGWGIFTRTALEVVEKVTTIDPIINPKCFAINTAGFENRITKINGYSQDILKNFEDESFDFIFIDGDHGYDGVKNDLKQAWRILNKNGTLMLDDVWHKGNDSDDYGVMKAIKEFCFENNKIVRICPYAHGVAIINKFSA